MRRIQPAYVLFLSYLAAALPGVAAEPPATYGGAMRWYETAAEAGSAEAQ